MVSWATIRESENLLTGARLLPRASPQQKRVAAAQPAHREAVVSYECYVGRPDSATAARPGHAEYALAFMRLSTRFAVNAPHRGACRCGNVTRVTSKRLSMGRDASVCVCESYVFLLRVVVMIRNARQRAAATQRTFNAAGSSFRPHRPYSPGRSLWPSYTPSASSHRRSGDQNVFGGVFITVVMRAALLTVEFTYR